MTNSTAQTTTAYVALKSNDREALLDSAVMDCKFWSGMNIKGSILTLKYIYEGNFTADQKFEMVGQDINLPALQERGVELVAIY